MVTTATQGGTGGYGGVGSTQTQGTSKSAPATTSATTPPSPPAPAPVATSQARPVTPTQPNAQSTTPGLPPDVANMINNLLGQGFTQSAIGQQGAQDQLGYTGLEYTNEQQQAQQQYGFTQQQQDIQGQQLGLQGQSLGNQGAYEQFQHGLTQQNFANELQNLLAGYGFQKQQQGLTEKSETSQQVGAGTYNTATRTQAEQQLGLTAAEQAQQFRYATEQQQLQQKGSDSSYWYQKATLANAKANLQTQYSQLGLSATEAKAGLQNALTNAGLQNVMTVDQLETGIAQIQAGMASPIQSVLSTLIQASPMVQALVGGQ